ncbi:dockerin type I domain-containing protein [Planctomycetota bacterium]
MKKLILLMLFFVMAPQVQGALSTRVCLADGNTPLEYQDIMVGTKLTIIVSSDANDSYIPCDLAIERVYSDYGVLSARDFNESTNRYDGAILEAASEIAYAYNWNDDFYQVDGISFTGEGDAGDWFFVDYTAIGIGDCNVGFYDWFFLAYDIPFTHVRTRDFNNDTKVGFADFATLALYWQETTCGDSNDCQGTDLDINGTVDANDLMLFTDYWLEKTQ